MAWYTKNGADSDIAVSSRIRLARNLEKYPFPTKCTDAHRSEIIETVTRVLSPAGLTTVDPAALSASARRTLVEKHYISPAFAADTAPRALLLDEEKQAAVMLCEEDHIRIQTLAPGFALNEAFESAEALDKLLDAGTDIAYSESLGYLTHCPTNLGTAMRASVMLHLPALRMSGKLPAIIRSLTRLGVTVRGVYGEGSESSGSLYQISNSATLGLTEWEIIEKLDGVVRRLIESERKLRDSMKSDSFARLCDKVMRARGTLKSAYLLPASEFMELWSDVRLGVSLGILEGITTEELSALMINAMPSNLLTAADASDDTPESELSVLRAKYVRETMK